MNKIVISLAVVCALAAAGCDRKGPDGATPKTGQSSSGSSTSSGSSGSADSTRSSPGSK